MIKLKNLLVEAAVMDMPMAEELVQKLNKELKAPYVHAQVSTLGGRDRPSVMVQISLDPKTEWANGIYHNSRWSMWHIGYDGAIDQHAKSHVFDKKFRKARFTKSSEVVTKINKYIKQVS